MMASSTLEASWNHFPMKSKIKCWINKWNYSVSKPRLWSHKSKSSSSEVSWIFFGPAVCSTIHNNASSRICRYRIKCLQYIRYSVFCQRSTYYNRWSLCPQNALSFSTSTVQFVKFLIFRARKKSNLVALNYIGEFAMYLIQDNSSSNSWM